MAIRHYRALDPQIFATWQDGLKQMVAQVPMLILWGDRDPYIQPNYAERFGAKEVVHFPNCGHWLAVEAPLEAAERVVKFFA